MNKLAYELNSPNVIAESFDTDLVLLNLRSGAYFNLSERGHKFCDALVAGNSPSDLIEQISLEDKDAGDSAKRFFEKLMEFELFRPKTDASVAKLQLATVVTLLAAGPAFVFEHYSDLADLVAADPIHDVSPTAGWPIQS